MAKGIIIAGRRVRFRFFIFLAMIIVFLIYLIKLMLSPPLYDIVKHGEITSWEQCEGLVIRQEKAYTAPEFGEVEFFVTKGQLVNKDELLAVVYKDGYDDKLMDSLYNTKQKIWDYQNKNLVQEIMDSDFDKIEEDIDSIVYTMQYSIQKDEFHHMEKYENQLRGLLDRKKEILDKKESASKYLEQLYRQEEDIENKLKEWKVEITAPESGIISFELDGLENIITPKDIDYFTAEQYLTFIDYEPLELDKENTHVDVPLYKIVVPDKWYIVSLIPHKNIFYEQGDTLSLKIPGLSEEIISATVYKVDFLKDSTLVILEMIENIESVIEARNIHIEIGISAEGLMVPTEAITNKDNRTGVRVERNGDINFVEVKVKAVDDEWAIIEKINDYDALELNDSVIIK